MCLSKAQVEESNGATIEKLILYGGILTGIGGFALLWIVVGVALDWFGCCENRDCWSYEGTCPYCFISGELLLVGPPHCTTYVVHVGGLSRRLEWE